MLWEKEKNAGNQEKMLVTSIFFLFPQCSQRLLSEGHENRDFFSRELRIHLYSFFLASFYTFHPYLFTKQQNFELVQIARISRVQNECHSKSQSIYWEG